jgi:hypothetical protein
MRTRRRATIQDLRLAIDCLPARTKVAMLEGIRSNEIIVGAYTSGRGICPMLAAHRAGGRTSCISFAKAWDRFAARGTGLKRPRPATERELLILRTHLEASLLEEHRGDPQLAAAIAEHRELVDRRAAGDGECRRELRRCEGRSWMRVVRRYDDYMRALEQLDCAHRALSERELV